jgi:effector-binding domain-containing protein
VLSIADLARLANVSPALLHDLEVLGLLTPDAVDDTGAPAYRAAALPRLHRLLALRDLGFDVSEVGALLDEDLSVDAMRGMLRLRQAQVDRNVDEERARLRRIDNHLRALERGLPAAGPTIVVRRVNAMRIARAAGRALGFGEALGPVIGRLLVIVDAHLRRAGVRPGTCVAWFEGPAADGSVTLHAGFTVGAQPVPDSADVRVVNLPGAEVASALHHGPMDAVEPVYAAMLAWISERGYRRGGADRELYLRWNDRDPAGNVTELQIPIDRAPPVEQPWRRPVDGTATTRIRTARGRIEPWAAGSPATDPPPAGDASPNGAIPDRAAPDRAAPDRVAPSGTPPTGTPPPGTALTGTALNGRGLTGTALNGTAARRIEPNGAVLLGAVPGGKPAAVGLPAGSFSDDDRGAIDIRYPHGEPPDG